jgi:hypothetical protein
VTRKVRILDVKYNASNNELVRTQTLVKNAIVEVDAAPFKQWYLQHYGVELGKKGAEEKKAAAAAAEGDDAGKEVRGRRATVGGVAGGAERGGRAAVAPPRTRGPARRVPLLPRPRRALPRNPLTWPYAPTSPPLRAPTT